MGQCVVDGSFHLFGANAWETSEFEQCPSWYDHWDVLKDPHMVLWQPAGHVHVIGETVSAAPVIPGAAHVNPTVSEPGYLPPGKGGRMGERCSATDLQYRSQEVLSCGLWGAGNPVEAVDDPFQMTTVDQAADLVGVEPGGSQLCSCNETML